MADGARGQERAVAWLGPGLCMTCSRNEVSLLVRRRADEGSSCCLYARTKLCALPRAAELSHVARICDAAAEHARDELRDGLCAIACDVRRHQVLLLSVWPSRADVAVIAGSKEGGQRGFRDGSAAVALFNRPVAACACAARPGRAPARVFVSDAGNHALRLVENGNVRAIAGGVRSSRNGRMESGSADGVGQNARLNGPSGLAVDPETGDVFVCDSFNGTLRRARELHSVCEAGLRRWQLSTVARGFDSPATVAFNPFSRKLFVSDKRGLHELAAPPPRRRPLAGGLKQDDPQARLIGPGVRVRSLDFCSRRRAFACFDNGEVDVIVLDHDSAGRNGEHETEEEEEEEQSSIASSSDSRNEQQAMQPRRGTAPAGKGPSEGPPAPTPVDENLAGNKPDAAEQAIRSNHPFFRKQRRKAGRDSRS